MSYKEEFNINSNFLDSRRLLYFRWYWDIYVWIFRHHLYIKKIWT